MFKDFTYNYKRIKVMKVVLIAMLSIILSAGSGCISKEEPETKLPTPQTTPQSTPLLTPPPPPTEYLSPDVEIYADNPTPAMDKGGSIALNLTIIGNNVTGGTSISFAYDVLAIYPDGNSIKNPPEINLSFKPQQVVFPKTVNRTQPPYKSYSSLIITSTSDADYFITIKIIDKKLVTIRPNI